MRRPGDPLDALLRVVRRRLLWRRLLRRVGAALPVAFLVASAAIGLDAGRSPVLRSREALAGATAIIAALAVSALRRRPTLLCAARRIDERLSLPQTVETAAGLRGGGDPVSTLVRGAAARRVRGLDPSTVAPLWARPAPGWTVLASAAGAVLVLVLAGLPTTPRARAPNGGTPRPLRTELLSRDAEGLPADTAPLEVPPAPTPGAETTRPGTTPSNLDAASAPGSLQGPSPDREASPQDPRLAASAADPGDKDAGPRPAGSSEPPEPRGITRGPSQPPREPVQAEARPPNRAAPGPEPNHGAGRAATSEARERPQAGAGIRSVGSEPTDGAESPVGAPRDPTTHPSPARGPATAGDPSHHDSGGLAGADSLAGLPDPEDRPFPESALRRHALPPGLEDHVRNYFQELHRNL